MHERSLATRLQVDEEITGIDFALETGFTLSGRITDQSDGSPVTGVAVLLYDRIEGGWISNTITDSNGEYQFSGMAADTFYVGSDGNVRLSDQEFERQYIPRFYENADRFEEATPIILNADRSGIDLQLEKGITLSGTVTWEQDGTVIPFARLSMVDSTGEAVFWTIADSAGNYEFEGVSRGTYYVVADGDVETHQGPQQAFMKTWYVSAYTMQEATAVDLNQDTDGIDIKVPKGFTLSGRITEKGTGAPVADTDVRILDQQYEEILTTRTDAEGRYEISGLPPGQYYIEATGVNLPTRQHTHQTGYYPGVEQREEATLVDVQSDTSGFDFSLYRVKSISGRVMNENATLPISNIEVNVYDPQWNHLANMPSDSGGYFQFRQVSADSVYLHATGFNSYLQKTVFKEEYYPEAPSRDGAELISLAGDSSGFIFTLDRGITVSGYVSDAKTGLPVAHADVEILAPDFEFIAAASTDSAGLYQITTLDSGSYYLRASGWVRPWHGEHRQVYQEKYYPQAEQRQAAELIRIARDSCCFNFTLSKGASISGRVVDEEGQPVKGAIIDLFNQNDEPVMMTETNSEGYYKFDGISKESYYLFCFGNVHPEDSWEWIKQYQQNWYPNSIYREGAQLVAVDGEISGIDFVLKSGFSISGRVMQATDSSVVKDMYVSLYAGNWSHLFHVTSDSNGFYSFNGLLPEDYYLEVTGRVWDADLNLEKEIYFRQYYPAVLPRDSAETLSVQSDLSGIDFYLRPSAFVCGRIYTYEGAVPISNMRILLYDSLWQVMREEQTRQDGRYTIGGFDDGSYYLCATGGIWNESIFWYDDLYLPVYYPQTRDSTEAQLLKIEGEVIGIDIMTKLLTQVVEEEIALPQTYEMHIYPNPFNPQTQIEYSLPKNQEINISVFNLRGQKIRTLAEGYHNAGNHRLIWRADTDNRAPVASGIYFCVFRSENNIVRTQKMLFLK
ncbi:T9SS type A sorting domain-containing protein [candidate division KSB1 bacterium]|nr:T9SS type A sorting domain-containing protein [candidate division KSB1 bacterium]